MTARPGNRLWEGYLAFYNTAVTEQVTQTTWDRLHDPAEPMYALGAFLDDALVLWHRALHSFHRCDPGRFVAGYLVPS